MPPDGHTPRRGGHQHVLHQVQRGDLLHQDDGERAGLLPRDPAEELRGQRPRRLHLHMARREAVPGPARRGEDHRAGRPEQDIRQGARGLPRVLRPGEPAAEVRRDGGHRPQEAAAVRVRPGYAGAVRAHHGLAQELGGIRGGSGGEGPGPRTRRHRHVAVRADERAHHGAAARGGRREPVGGAELATVVDPRRALLPGPLLLLLLYS
mmetsp:Transcript_8069/g.28359  ORF Transcript_8069/g.28359 Transcript_8069/m.28359 type:complete len:208 (+) Transcript_8069:1183-1806(+)